MSIHFQNEREFERWRKRARELRARAEHSPEDVPVILEILEGLEKLQGKLQKHERRIRTLESQIQKAYAQYMTGGDIVG